MENLSVKQGTSEWLEARRSGWFCASDAPAALGLSEHTSRTALLDRLATGITIEPTEYQKKLFKKGLDAEALAKPFAESIIADNLYPVVGVTEIDGMQLLASFDGITMAEDVIFENKLWGEELALAVANGDVPETHWPQLEHQLLVSGADYVLFMVSTDE